MKNVSIVFFFLAIILPVHAERAVEVQDSWIRYIPGDRPMAGYLVMENGGDTDRHLIGVTSTAFGAVHIHETVERDGQMSMQPVDSITVPAGGRVALQPGGYHLMLMQLQSEIEVGDEVSMTLEFADGGSQGVVFAVKPAWQE